MPTATCTACADPLTHSYRPPSSAANREPDFEPRCDAHGYGSPHAVAERDAADRSTVFGPAELAALPVGAAFRDDHCQDPAGWTFTKGGDGRWSAPRSGMRLRGEDFLKIHGPLPWGDALRLVSLGGSTLQGEIVGLACQLRELAIEHGATFSLSVSPTGALVQFVDGPVPNGGKATPNSEHMRLEDSGVVLVWRAPR